MPALPPASRSCCVKRDGKRVSLGGCPGGNGNFGYLLPPPPRGFQKCETNVIFAFRVAPAAWVVQFFPANVTTIFATVTITQTVQLIH